MNQTGYFAAIESDIILYTYYNLFTTQSSLD